MWENTKLRIVSLNSRNCELVPIVLNYVNLSSQTHFWTYNDVNMSFECVLFREFGLGENKTQMKHLLLHLNANLQYHK